MGGGGSQAHLEYRYMTPSRSHLKLVGKDSTKTYIQVKKVGGWFLRTIIAASFDLRSRQQNLRMLRAKQ